MRILIVNDDGIRSSGLISLARMHRISVFGAVGVQPEPDFPVNGVKAYSISGSPADCVKVALAYIMKERPDVVFSGINNGYNVGIDILYSGTVGAAMEALVNGIPAIAFSNRTNEDQRVSERYLLSVAKDLLAREISKHEIWNVNFPSCDPDAVKGILYGRIPAKKSYYETIYTPSDSDVIPGEPLPGAEEAAPADPRTEKAQASLLDIEQELRTAFDMEEKPAGPGQEVRKPGHVVLLLSSIVATEAEEGSDMQAVFDGYISIGKVRNTLLMP